MHTFRDVETAAYCPRKLYYRRRDGPPDVPERVGDVRALAFEYDRLLDDDAALLAAPTAVPPGEYRERLRSARDRLDAWPELVDPPRRDVRLSGRDCRGIAHKVLGSPEPAPTLAFTGEPPDQGVWEPQSVRLVAAAKALSWEREETVDHGYAEYPAYGRIRRVELTTRRKGAYRSAVRTADGIDGPPPRLRGSAKCEPCEYRERCGVRTRSLRSLL